MPKYIYKILVSLQLVSDKCVIECLWLWNTRFLIIKCGILQTYVQM